MSTDETADEVESLRQFVESVQAMESADRSVAFTTYFSLERVESLVEQWHDNEFRLEALLAQLGAIRGMGVRVRELKQTIKRASRRARQQRQQDVLQQIVSTDTLNENLPDYLVEGFPSLLIPNGFDVDLGGVYTLQPNFEDGTVNREKIATAPIIITQRGRDTETGHMQVEVAWAEPPGPGKGRPKWRTHTVERSVLFDSRKIVSLIDYGAPVTSITAADTIRWLTAYEDINQHKIPLTNGANRLGWQKDGSFLLPDGHIKLDKHQELKLFPMEGMDPILKSLRTGGTWEGWLEVVELLRDHPLAMLSIYASVASVMQHIVKCANFSVDWSNETSSGKTTSLRVAASVWGYPADDDDEGFIYSWDSTKVWVERAAGFLHSLPLILDETKRVKNKQHVADVLYDFCSGKGRGRGTLQGIDKVNTWNTVLLSTGEQRLTSFTQDGGVRARVLALQGAPISGPAQTARVVADTVRGRLYIHYGHLGRRVVKYLVYHKDSWKDFREAFETRRDNYAGVTNTAVGGRLAAYVSALDLAKAVCETLGVPEPTRDPIEFLIQAVRDGANDADRARDAFVAAASWAAMNRHRFWGSRAALENGTPGNGWAGRWDDVKPEWDEVCIEPHALQGILDRYGYVFDEVVPRWGARDWLHVTSRGLTRSRRIDGIPTPCVCLRRDVYEELLTSDRPDIETVNVVEAQLELIEERVSYGDSSWSALARGED